MGVHSFDFPRSEPSVARSRTLTCLRGQPVLDLLEAATASPAFARQRDQIGQPPGEPRLDQVREVGRHGDLLFPPARAKKFFLDPPASRAPHGPRHHHDAGGPAGFFGQGRKTICPSGPTTKRIPAHAWACHLGPWRCSAAPPGPSRRLFLVSTAPAHDCAPPNRRASGPPPPLPRALRPPPRRASASAAACASSSSMLTQPSLTRAVNHHVLGFLEGTRRRVPAGHHPWTRSPPLTEGPAARKLPVGARWRNLQAFYTPSSAKGHQHLGGKAVEVNEAVLDAHLARLFQRQLVLLFQGSRGARA